MPLKKNSNISQNIRDDLCHEILKMAAGAGSVAKTSA
jgi:hypothetical protein